MTIDDLRFMIQAHLFAMTHNLYQVVVSHNAPGNVKIDVIPESAQPTRHLAIVPPLDVVRHVADIAKQLLPSGTGVEVSSI